MVWTFLYKESQAMRLKQITFTGIDEKTDIAALKEIQKEYPMVEWGMLTSYHWGENGNRYPNPRLTRNLIGTGLNLSLHLCGKAAIDAANGQWNHIEGLVRHNLSLFKRIQLNIAEKEDTPTTCCLPPYIKQEIIIQQRSIQEIGLYKRTMIHSPYYDYFSVLLDASGGRGKDTPIEVLKTKNHVGYAGGINPDNVAEKLSYLFNEVKEGTFWIDMESGVRTDDWVDLDKVVKVLEICKPIIEKGDAQ